MYTPDHGTLEKWVSPARLATYKDEADPVATYFWNAELSAAFFELICHVEVLLRNAIHSQASAWATRSGGVTPWFDDPYYGISGRTAKNLADAKRAAGPGASEDKVVAELSFGFWRYLLTNHYRTTLWPRITRGFAGLPSWDRSPSYVSEPAVRINKFRNRVAHHEPIFRANTAQAFADLITLAEMVDPAAARTLWERQRIHDVMRRRP